MSFSQATLSGDGDKYELTIRNAPSGQNAMTLTFVATETNVGNVSQRDALVQAVVDALGIFDSANPSGLSIVEAKKIYPTTYASCTESS